MIGLRWYAVVGIVTSFAEFRRRVQEHSIGQTHTLSHTGPNPEWNERITYAPEHCVDGLNLFRVRWATHSGAMQRD
jgi:hypothetical protein